MRCVLKVIAKVDPRFSEAESRARYEFTVTGPMPSLEREGTAMSHKP